MTDKNIPTAEETTPGNDGEKSFNLMQTVKRRLYAMRNGALAAQMRNGGAELPYQFRGEHTTDKRNRLRPLADRAYNNRTG